MGLFKKFKKDNKVEEIIDPIENENIDLDEVKKGADELEKVCLKLEEQIKEKNDRLRNITEKIDLSKKEYDDIVGKIIQSKKELRSQVNSEPNTKQLTETKDQDIRKISKEITDSKMKLKEIQEEIKKKLEINEELKQKIKKNEPVFLDSKEQKKKIDEELEQRKKELEVLKKRLTEMKNTDMKTEVGDDSKSVVEAASQIVATTNKRLQDTMKELDIIRQLLDKERKAHNETKKKL
ncbi:hypothetical protein OAJ55_01670 [Candidatus Nitrosopelagicus sp.]|nr:hypothetical protein [Candidatus Nitrosopelagicus sp.]